MRLLGPSDAPIAILCDYPSPGEYASQSPLSDYAGGLFFEILSRKGLLKSSCFILPLLEKPLPDDEIDSVLSKRKTCPAVGWERIGEKWASPELVAARKRALALLEQVRPRMVIALGDLALWALTGNLGITKWRGSRLSAPGYPFQVVPTLHPRILPRSPESSHLFQIDLARAKAIYEGTQLPRNYQFEIAPTFGEAKSLLLQLLDMAAEKKEFPISLDLETRSGHMACIGLAWRAEDAICIPLITVNDTSPFYWSEEEEAELVFLMAKLLRHPNVVTIGQNISYDCQYLYRHWGFLPARVRDTMIGHHSIFSNMRKGLDFLSAMYAQDHVYWKGESKDWDPSMGEKQYWIYNCKDACITWEIWPEIVASMESKSE